MSIQISEHRCRGCGKCVEACPGNLIKKNAAGKAYIKRPDECWGCTSCLKECAFGSITFYLGADIGGMGGQMHTRVEGDLCHWVFQDRNGEEKVISVNQKDANKY